MFSAAHIDGSLCDLSRKTRSPGVHEKKDSHPGLLVFVCRGLPPVLLLCTDKEAVLRPRPAFLRRVLLVCFRFCGSFGFRSGFCVPAGASQILFLKLRDPLDRFVFRKGKGF